MPLAKRILDLLALGLICLLAAFVVSASELDAQASAGVVTIKGRIRDEADTAVVVARARVELVGTGEVRYSGEEGRFQFSGAFSDRLELRVQMVGFHAATVQLKSHGAERTIEVFLKRLPRVLTEVRIEGRIVKVPPRLESVYARAARSWGTLITRDDIERARALDTKSLLQTIPTVWINDNGITFHKCQVSLNGVSLVPSAGRNAASLMTPTVQVYVDGNRLTRPGGDDANEVLKSIHPSSIEAIEVYTGVARIPAEFLSDACAVIAIWTRSY